MSKQGKRRATSPRKYRAPFAKTGPKRDHLEYGYKPHDNAIQAESIPQRFIPKMGTL